MLHTDSGRSKSEPAARIRSGATVGIEVALVAFGRVGVQRVAVEIARIVLDAATHNLVIVWIGRSQRPMTLFDNLS